MSSKTKMVIIIVVILIGFILGVSFMISGRYANIDGMFITGSFIIVGYGLVLTITGGWLIYRYLKN